jgi:hypothetical protein
MGISPLRPTHHLHNFWFSVTFFKDLKFGASNVQVVVVTVNNNLISITKNKMEGNDYLLDRIGHGQRGSDLERCTGKCKK